MNKITVQNINLFFFLRILAIHGAKTIKNQTPWCILLDHFTTRPSNKNLYDTFYDQVARDDNNV